MENKKNMNVILAVVICLALVGVLIFISVKNKVDNTNMPSNNISTNDTNLENSANNNVIPSGDVAKSGDVVSMNYTGRLENGMVFDSNVDPQFKHVEPFVFNLGAGQVISGWDKGIVGMKVGEKKTLTISPEDAYGASGVPGLIPPNSTLIFEVELVGINK